MTNTREAKAFAVLSEEGIAKGIRRVTAVTTDRAFKALELAFSLEQEANEASVMEGSLLEQKVTSLSGRMESALIPAAKKADLKAKLSILRNQVFKVRKMMEEENKRKAVKVAIEKAEAAISEGKPFCILYVNDGSDTKALREAVRGVVKEMAVMAFSTDENANKTLACAGVPKDGEKTRR